MASRLKTYLSRSLDQLRRTPIDQLVERRYEKFRDLGAYLERLEDGQVTPAGSPIISEI
jgi:acetyl-CoA carboxylase carboxyl transferase subunit alpha